MALLGLLLLVLWPAARSMSAIELQHATNSAIANGSSLLSVPAGDFYFNSSAFAIDQAHNLVIQGQADAHGIPTTTLWFSMGGSVSVFKSHNVTLRNVAIDFNGTYAQGSVLTMAEDGMSFTADFMAELLLPDPATVPFFNGSVKVCFWFPTNRTMIRHTTYAGAVNIFANTLVSMGPTSPDSIIFNLTVDRNVTEWLGPLPPGALVTAMPAGHQHSLVAINTSSSLFDNVHIYGGSFMGIVEGGGEGGNTYHAVNITRRPFTSATGSVVDRLLAVNADGFHSTSNTVGPTVVNSQISWTGDDHMNICSAMMVVLDAWQATATTLRIALLDNANNMVRVQPGDTHAFYHLNTEVYQAQAVVERVAISTNATILAQAADLFHVLTNPPYNADFAPPVLSDSNRPYELDITVTQGSLAAIAGYWSLVHFDRFKNAGAVVAHSHFHDGYARSMLIKGSNSTVVNNVLERAGGVHMGPEQSWLEGDPGITNITFANNVLTACGTPAIQQQPCMAANHARVDLSNNTIHAWN